MGLYKSEYLIAQAVNLDYRAIGMTVLVIYVVLLTVYTVGAIIGYSIKYDLSRGNTGSVSPQPRNRTAAQISGKSSTV